jgi:hypothetical protein
MSRSRTAALPLNTNAPNREPVAETPIGLQSETVVLETHEFELPADDPAPAALVPVLIQAIAEAKRAVSVDRHAYLRRAIREQYRLLEAGLLSAQACSDGTRRILGKFDSENGV